MAEVSNIVRLMLESDTDRLTVGDLRAFINSLGGADPDDEISFQTNQGGLIFEGVQVG